MLQIIHQFKQPCAFSGEMGWDGGGGSNRSELLLEQTGKCSLYGEGEIP